MYLFIVNRNSGNGGGYRVWKKIQELLHHRSIPYDYIFTQSAEEAHSYLIDRLANKSGWSAVGVVGGDGTIHSLLPAMRDSGVPLAVFPAGSGNDTARGFRIPRKTAAALDIMLEGMPRSTDLISISGGSTLTALAVGFDAEVAHNVNRSRYKKICNWFGMGRLAYVIGVFHTLLTFRPAPLTVECDGQEYTYTSGWLAAVNNVTTYGGGLSICPEAKPDDGLLDICIVHDCSRFKLMLLFPTLLFGKHTRFSFVSMLRGRNVTVRSSLPRLALGDGEPVSSTPLTASADPGALRVMCPHTLAV
ncbi:YegS/Rv2252/BmrU family lipid kinase [Fontibacillus phaseoli]|uniref:YegS/Rv2252/BmrU family lipid kinase n=1 Tax=Fontibacillus phaseoli TaxID=1416533 RepID=A0A369BME1_9BACL|nr:diacylglycerol kinase family protein [Fontibacillus phaseoli]RCX21766.1 YegS/Rv2252/BmrU family lipid kinase [Fontibacillus phaseoli]